MRDKRTRTKKVICVKTYSGNEVLDLTVYCHAGLFALLQFIAPAIYRDLGKPAEAVQQGQPPEASAVRVRHVRSSGVI